MGPIISSDLLQQIVAEAALSPHVEICGLLLGQGGRVEDARLCRNVAANPFREFEIDPAALLEAHREARSGGLMIVGCYHSHPSGHAAPSLRDAAAAEPNGWLWLIVAGHEVRAWRAQAGGRCHAMFDDVPVTGSLSAAG